MKLSAHSLPWRLGVLFLVVGVSSSFAGGTAGPPAAKAAKAAKAAPAASFVTPNVSEIIGDRVNIRAGGGINYRSLLVANKGDKVIVQQLKNDWAEIDIPQNVPLFIAKSYVKVDENGKGMITGSSVNVRPAPNLREPPMCQLNTNDQVRVLETSGDFYKIEAPADAKAWVLAKYIRFYGSLDELTAKAEKVKALKSEFADLVKKDREEQSKDPAKRDLAGLISRYDQFIETSAAGDDEVKQLAMQRRAELEEMRRLGDQLNERLNQSQTLIADLQNRYKGLEDKIAELTTPPPPPPNYLAKGRIEPLNYIGNRPGTHKLVNENGKVLFILASDTHNLEEFVGKEVGINGDGQKLAGWNAGFVEVQEIDVLDDLARR
ncbi:MAG: SH3 domain-containing protein [Planctomycetes bacterium]|nr:SH3 domain-containing protein [Planctomycetota bacterium]